MRRGLDRDWHGPMIRSLPSRDGIPASLSADRRAVPVARPATLRRCARRSRRDLDQARGPAAARVRRQQDPQPRIPAGGCARRRLRHARHQRPALVEPRTAHRRGRSEGGAGRASRPVRTAGRATGAGHPAVTLVRGDRPPARHRRSGGAGGGGRSRGDAVRAAGGRPYVIGVGGSGPIGVHGQRLAARELLAQADGDAPGLDRVVLPTATGGTQAGLLVGFRIRRRDGLRRRAIGRRPPALHRSRRRRARQDDRPGPRSSSTRRSSATATADRPRPPYEAADLLARTEAILVDPIYTAKALAGLVAGVRSGAWDGERIVFWHAGGLPGLFEPLD